VKKLSLWAALLALGLVAAYVIFLGALSLTAGLRQPDKDGFWVPIVAGGLCIVIVTWLFFRFARFFYHLAKRSERLQM
jgi:uncharacterized membrane protein HdeD (DUF308 family)